MRAEQRKEVQQKVPLSGWLPYIGLSLAALLLFFGQSLFALAALFGAVLFSIRWSDDTDWIAAHKRWARRGAIIGMVMNALFLVAMGFATVSAFASENMFLELAGNTLLETLIEWTLGFYLAFCAIKGMLKLQANQSISKS